MPPRTKDDYGSPIFGMDEDTKVDTFWFFAGDEWDFMGGIYTNDEGEWIFKYRFRYYNPEANGAAFDSGDEKNVYILGPFGEERVADVRNAARSMMKVMVEGHKNEQRRLTEMAIFGGAQKFTEVLSKQSFAHKKEIAKDPEREESAWTLKS